MTRAKSCSKGYSPWARCKHLRRTFGLMAPGPSLSRPLSSPCIPSTRLLCGDQGVSPRDLVFFAQMVVPYGGLRDINLIAVEAVLISPANGKFGGAAVHVALAMGARVIAMGRNETVLGELRDLSPGRVETVKLSGSWETGLSEISKHGLVDVFLDLTPPTASNIDHIRAGLLSARAGGRMNLMGGVPEIPISPPAPPSQGPYHSGYNDC
ncbi:alcohol dehydrogenase GroES domain-containing protein [Colletotrichum graminicola]|nr:alcohol dehydrogenase GroES domain-containing protein [Colletotrichum graminicola]